MYTHCRRRVKQLAQVGRSAEHLCSMSAYERYAYLSGQIGGQPDNLMRFASLASITPGGMSVLSRQHSTKTCSPCQRSYDISARIAVLTRQMCSLDLCRCFGAIIERYENGK